MEHVSKIKKNRHYIVSCFFPKALILLKFSAIHNHTDVVRYLLSYCAYSVDEQDSCGSTPFMDAIRIEALDIARILLTEMKVPHIHHLYAYLA